MLRTLLIGLVLCGSAGAVTPSTIWVDYYSGSSMWFFGEELPAGTVITVYDPDSVECGRQVADSTGRYPYLHVYGDDPLTKYDPIDRPNREDWDEGAIDGDTLTFYADGVPCLAIPAAVWQAADIRGQNRADLFPATGQFLAGEVTYGQHHVPMSGVSLVLHGPEDVPLTTSISGRFIYQLVPWAYTLDILEPPLETLSSVVTAYDASLILRSVVGQIGLPSSVEVADVSGDGTVAALDASLVLRYVVGLADAFPRGGPFLYDHSSVAFTYVEGEAQSAEFWVQALGDVSANWPDGLAKPAARAACGEAGLACLATDDGRFTYSMDVPAPVWSMEGRVTLNGAAAELVLPEGWIGESMRVGDVLRFAAAGDTPLEGPQDILLTTGRVDVRGMLNEAIPLVHERDLAAEDRAAPEVLLRLAVPGSGPVSLAVYSIGGQLVRTLVDDSHAPTQVAWDGKDYSGMDVASGVYIYRMITPTTSVTGRITLLR